MRSPACGSPETRSTRRFSRMPSISATARLLIARQLAGERRRPRTRRCWGRHGRCRRSSSLGTPACTVSLDSGCRRAVTATRDGRRRRLHAVVEHAILDGLLLADDAEARRAVDDDAAVVSRRRGRRSATCSGALKRSASAVGRDVVHLAVGEHDDRADALGRHVGERGRERAEQLGAVDRLAAGRRRRRRCVRTSMLWNAASRCFSALGRGAVVLSRPSSVWLALLSTTSATTVGQRLAFLVEQTGLASASSSASAAASARSHAPRMRRTRPGMTSSDRERPPSGDDQRPAAASGAKASRPVHALTARAARAAPGRAPGRPCSCRSACTSRC